MELDQKNNYIHHIMRLRLVLIDNHTVSSLIWNYLKIKIDNKHKRSNLVSTLPQFNCHANIKSTVKFEGNRTIPLSTSIYRKKTFTGLHTKWFSFTPRKYKLNLIQTLTFRICSSPSLLRSCLNEPWKLLLQIIQ